MRVCVQCHAPIQAPPAVWNLQVNGPCCTPECVQQALRPHPHGLTPEEDIYVAQSLSIAFLTPLEYEATLRRAAADAHPTIVSMRSNP